MLRRAANIVFYPKILLCLLYSLWECSEGIGMAAIRSPGTWRGARAEWGFITLSILRACVRCERDAQRSCGGARSAPKPPEGFW